MHPIQIIATIGPSTNTVEIIQAMIQAGMSLARLNFSWGTYDEHRQFIAMIRKAAVAEGVTVPIIQDISGPRVQAGALHSFDPAAAVLTEKDLKDVQAMADEKVEYIAQSFVKSAADINDLRSYCDDLQITPQIIAKIERKEAVDALTDIINVADGIMIARGDLGEAVPMETLPFVKKDILTQCVKLQTPTVVATEMLTSMIDDTDPSRADISDIAHAVLDGASATMLSNETAIGANPVETVAVMRKVVDEAQRHMQGKAVVPFIYVK